MKIEINGRKFDVSDVNAGTQTVLANVLFLNEENGKFVFAENVKIDLKFEDSQEFESPEEAMRHFAMSLF